MLLREPTASLVSKEWDELVKKAALKSSTTTKAAIVMSVCKAVFDVCQQHIVAFKGATLLHESEQELDPFEEAGIEADEAALYRLGGFALFSLLKNSHLPEEKCSVLKTLRLPLEEKQAFHLTFSTFTRET